MKTIIAALIIATALPATANARDLGETSTAGTSAPAPDDQCMLTATVRASYTDARDDEIYGIARKQCGYARAGAGDIEAAAAWTRTVGGLRDRRRQQDAMYGLRQIAAR